MSNSEDKAWYAVYTKHQHEKAASENLRKKGFEVLLPLYPKASQWKDRKKTILIPLFPCYLFLRTDLEQRLEILKAPGVFHLVESGGRACEVPPGDIESIRKITEGRSRFEPHPFLRNGDRVRVRSGPVAGLEGILVRIKGSHRVVISVELLQKAVSVEIDVSDLEQLRERSGLVA
jgi:transcription elongation factor/antiterminator RfaH